MHFTSQIAGEPLDQGVVQYGPFGRLYFCFELNVSEIDQPKKTVMTTKEEIQQTLLDCTPTMVDYSLLLLISSLDQMGRNGFEKARVWQSEIGH